jgi:four helix bundle protein
MTRIKSFEDIDAWMGARELTKRVYELTGKGSFARDFGLKDQICRASVSVMSNIAEGYESDSQKSFIRYLRIAKGSAGEVRSQLYVSLDQGYISITEFDSLCDKTRKVAAQLSNLTKYLESRL